MPFPETPLNTDTLATAAAVLDELADVIREGREMLADDKVTLEEVAELGREVLDLALVLTSPSIASRLGRAPIATVVRSIHAHARGTRLSLRSMRRASHTNHA